MFKIVQKPTESQCAAMRCKGSPEVCVDPERGIYLCEKHAAQWVAAGEPPLGGSAAPTGTALVPASEQAALEQERKDAQESLDLIRGLPNDTQDDMNLLGALGTEARQRVDALEERRKAATGPMNKALREINSWFKPARDFYQDGIKILNAKLAEGQARAQAAQDAALQAIEDQGGHADETTLVPAHEPVALPEGASIVKVPAYRITDVAALPRELLSPDDEKCRTFAAAALEQGIKEGPGIEFYFKDQVRQSRK